ncbi:MAG: RNA-binding protein hfq [Oscillatoriales cyanobacterium]|jgi:host factor-I protein|nr:MAG: RNA-binding protein hfq [Oscillatoriales cyanobacterium]
MSSEFDTSLPSIRLLQRYVKEKTTITLRLNDGSTLSGKLLWIDPIFLCLLDASEKNILVRRDSIALIMPQ